MTSTRVWAGWSPPPLVAYLAALALSAMRRPIFPLVVVELVLGIAVGPQIRAARTNAGAAIRAVMLLLLGLAFLALDSGAEFVLGAFIAGQILRLLSPQGDEQIEEVLGDRLRLADPAVLHRLGFDPWTCARSLNARR